MPLATAIKTTAGNVVECVRTPLSNVPTASASAEAMEIVMDAAPAILMAHVHALPA